MPKDEKKQKTIKQKPITGYNTEQRRPLYTLFPWSCQHYSDHSELKAYVPASGVWETIASVRHTAGASAETMAEYLMRVINEHEKYREMIDDMIGALELCLQSDGLTWEAEREAEITMRRAREKI